MFAIKSSTQGTYWNGGGYWQGRDMAQVYATTEEAAQEIRDRADDMAWGGRNGVITIEELA